MSLENAIAQDKAYLLGIEHALSMVSSIHESLGKLKQDSERIIANNEAILPKAAWVGIGLPPVGTVCEMDLRQGTSTEVEVLAYHGQQAWLRDTGKHSGVHYFTSEIDQARAQFRPLRTPEQIAAEERLHEIRNACSAVNSKVDQYNVNLDCSAAMRAVIEAMIDAGYRK